MFRSRVLPRLCVPLVARVARPLQPPLTRSSPYSSNHPVDRPPVRLPIDRERERKVGQQPLERHPDQVTATSSMAHPHLGAEMAAEMGARVPGDEPAPVGRALGRDLVAIKDALHWGAVPRGWYALGLSGTVPYFATSVATVYLGWAVQRGVGGVDAQHWLQVLEPVQLGYGAALISFVGGVHWYFEAKQTTIDPPRRRFNVGVGLLAVATAWPTLSMTMPFALTTQFLAFTGLFFADSRATARGWAPAWYATYRFVLTFIVCAALLVSLVYRAKADDAGATMLGASGRADGATGASRRMSKRLEEGKHQGGRPVEEAYAGKWERLEVEEKARRREEERKRGEEGEGGKKEEEKKEKSTEEELEKKEKEKKEEKKEKKEEEKVENDSDDKQKDSGPNYKEAAEATDGGKKK